MQIADHSNFFFFVVRLDAEILLKNNPCNVKQRYMVQLFLCLPNVKLITFDIAFYNDRVF